MCSEAGPERIGILEQKEFGAFGILAHNSFCQILFIFFDEFYCAAVYVVIFWIMCLSFSPSLFWIGFFSLQQRHNIRLFHEP